jgi:uncharacterized DUF497 family protein
VRKHQISFSEAATVFGDILGIMVSDPDHSGEEDRFITVGLSNHFRFLLVSYAEHGDRIRIISARELTRRERETYERGD